VQVVQQLSFLFLCPKSHSQFGNRDCVHYCTILIRDPIIGYQHQLEVGWHPPFPTRCRRLQLT
jgi:hypothetical protein